MDTQGGQPWSHPVFCLSTREGLVMPSWANVAWEGFFFMVVPAQLRGTDPLRKSSTVFILIPGYFYYEEILENGGHMRSSNPHPFIWKDPRP